MNVPHMYVLCWSDDRNKNIAQGVEVEVLVPCVFYHGDFFVKFSFLLSNLKQLLSPQVLVIVRDGLLSFCVVFPLDTACGGQLGLCGCFRSGLSIGFCDVVALVCVHLIVLPVFL